MTNSLKISRIQENDIEAFRTLVKLLNEVFEESNQLASDRQMRKLLKKPDFHAIVAIQEGKVVGGLTAYELESYYSDKRELYIYDIAVITALHNQGIGKAMIDYVKNYSVKNEIETIFVDAHSEDEQAVKFYESTLGKGQKVDHFTFEIKKQ